MAELSDSLDSTIKALRNIYANCSDIVFRTFYMANQTRAVIVYLDGLADHKRIDDHMLAPLMQETLDAAIDFDTLLERVLTVSEGKKINTFTECIHYIANGWPILLQNGERAGIALSMAHWEKRGIEEPTAESSIRGPREGFTEILQINLSQIRRIIKSPSLKTESLVVGKYTHTKVVIAYMDGLADTSLVEEVKIRIQHVRADGVFESGYIEKMIEEKTFSPFPQLLNTERPDVVSSGLLEGRVAILMEGSPFALIAPATLFSLLQAAEDYYQRFIVGTLIQWLRYIFFLIALFLPSIYVAILTFHQEMVPGFLLFSVASSREAVPFPAIVEALLMEVSFEALREAGVRLPKQIGSAVSIVGALVIGQAAVQAGLVSAPMVIVVAITGIASFMIPRYNAGIAVRMLRFPMIFLGGSLGLLGIMMGFIALVLHLCSLRPFGVSYLSPLNTRKRTKLNDVPFRR